jgi:hypothetical protein
VKFWNDQRIKYDSLGDITPEIATTLNAIIYALKPSTQFQYYDQ